MIVTAWNNGTYHESGAGYGIKLHSADRDRYFNKNWKTAFIQLEGQSIPIEVNPDKPSFWNETCRELISQEIGRWLIRQRLAPWRKGKPPKLVLEPIGDNRFWLHKAK